MGCGVQKTINVPVPAGGLVFQQGVIQDTDGDDPLDLLVPLYGSALQGASIGRKKFFTKVEFSWTTIWISPTPCASPTCPS
jgi:hypothetical protein